MSEPRKYFITLHERTHAATARMAWGRQPTWISGPDQDHILVLHVQGSAEYLEGGGQQYAPSRFIVLRVEEISRTVEGRVELEGVVVVEIAGIPKKPSKRRGRGGIV